MLEQQSGSFFCYCLMESDRCMLGAKLPPGIDKQFQ
jgi:hypothetical protein